MKRIFNKVNNKLVKQLPSKIISIQKYLNSILQEYVSFSYKQNNLKLHIQELRVIEYLKIFQKIM